MSTGLDPVWAERVGRVHRVPAWHPSRWSARTTSVVALGVIAAAVAVVLVLTSHWIAATREGFNQQARDQMAGKASALVERVRDLLDSAEDSARRVAQVARSVDAGLWDSPDTQLMEVLAAELAVSVDLENVYIGFPDGRFLRAGRVPTNVTAEMPQAQELRQRVDPRRPIERAQWQYRSQAGVPVGEEQRDDGFDPRVRPWFVAATAARAGVWTEPYPFWLTGRPGVTYAIPLPDGSVVGVDIRLDRLAEFVLLLAADPAVDIAIVDHAGGVLSTRTDLAAPSPQRDELLSITALGPPALAMLWPLTRAAQGQPITFDQDRRVGIGSTLSAGAFTWTVLATVPKHLFLGGLDTLTRQLAWLSGAMAGAAALMALAMGAVLRSTWRPVLAELQALDQHPEPVPAPPEASESERAQTYIDRIRAAREHDLQSLGEARVVLNAMANAVSNLSHELRTPTGLVLANAQALRLGISGALPPMAMTMLETIEAAGTQLSAHVEQILAYADLRTGLWQRADHTVDVSALVRTTMEVMQDLARQRDVELVLAVEDNLVTSLEGDRLRQALTHLLANAIMYAGPKTMVAIVALAAEAEIQICVSDSGRGLDPEDVKLAFEPFLRPGYDRWIAAPPSLGLGIAMAEEQMRRLGGALMLTSAKDFGLIAMMVLPREAVDGV